MYNKGKGSDERMDIETRTRLSAREQRQWEDLLARAGLEPDAQTEQTVLIWDGETLAATGSRQGALLKCIAVDPDYRGEDLTATVLTRLRSEAFAQGYTHLFLYTKPENRRLFQGLFFYPVAHTSKAALLENRENGIGEFLKTLPKTDAGKTVGATVMNCNPFTLGHRYLIEAAARECDHVYVFVLSEDKSRFSSADRMEMVQQGCADLPNVTVLPTGPYLISAATFPTYFLKDREQAPKIHCDLDIAVFGNHFVPHFGITRRYVGTEPMSPLTESYNRALQEQLPRYGVQVREVPRLETKDGIISASRVRALLDAGGDIRHFVTETTYQFLTQGGKHHG